MDRLYLEGPCTVSGEIDVQGAKNSVLPILAGALLTDQQIVLTNCPDIRDVRATFQILKYLGCSVDYDNGVAVICAAGMNRSEIPDALMREMRSSIMLLGAILGRMGTARLGFPGGCELGPRPIDLHISSLRRLGVTFLEEHGFLDCTAAKLHGADIHLALPSVGATENILLLACVTPGTTRIFNAAKEPEIEDLQNFLNAMGAKITGAGGSTITIEGVEKLHGAEYRIMPDRIVTVSYLAAAAISGGEILVRKACPPHVISVTSLLEESGCEIEMAGEDIRLRRRGPIEAVKQIRTMPYPGFPTDALAPIMAYLTLAQGTSIFYESIFQNRYKHVEELLRMGANIKVEGRVAIVEGVKKLTGASLVATDLRGGMALLIAGIAAEGETEITEVSLVERGYEHMVRNFSSLGVKIREG
ncbi:UDP-N-acetylglucosamine 1-carboxyvinyltransferase [Feifania hominis]|uniref:UDP-N-acetylglucosamine 1-carboxyvinyltransferase n=1 Tax=Feifania hominis TaxID=2763660 RepID=A0A926HSU5_9FIRM|nr:UDP-N-acetylglucosamine 1-carboxyvinyltransferase [Feifania hominis]MBC8535189.1 UDP-N-acetylglucosamine 1-carboxyvinyltransferase [Feifania hominis]